MRVAVRANILIPQPPSRRAANSGRRDGIQSPAVGGRGALFGGPLLTWSATRPTVAPTRAGIPRGARSILVKRRSARERPPRPPEQSGPAPPPPPPRPLLPPASPFSS